jgi:hypothetical protein
MGRIFNYSNNSNNSNYSNKSKQSKQSIQKAQNLQKENKTTLFCYLRFMEEVKEKYGNRAKYSTITHYAIGDIYINIWYQGISDPKKYSYESATESKVLKMIELAKSGKGLNRYIITKVKGLYER